MPTRTKPAKSRPLTKAGTPRKRKGVKLTPTELKSKDLLVDDVQPPERELIEHVEADGGQVLAVYREPLGGNVQLFVALPIDKIEPTPFQRDASDSHVRKLTVAMDRTRRYLDPIIAVRIDGTYYTPNGNHRLTAMRELGAKTILALLIPDYKVGYQILALNIEKAHNLREKSLEVARMYDELTEVDAATKESAYSLEFEEPQFITLGFAYEQRPRLSGGAYQPVLRKVDGFLDKPLWQSFKERERRAKLVLDFDDAVSAVVAKLKAKGLDSPYLKTFVVARVNPLRFMKGEPPPFDDLLETMTRRADRIDTGRINISDLSRAGGAPDED
ncbi:MAG TPA: ParB/RepB/Spo0J family partition protein [Candidatus Obscuribacterales bacterium]